MFLQASSPRKQTSSSSEDGYQPNVPNIMINDVGDEFRITTDMGRPGSVIGERSDESEKARDSILSSASA